MTEDLPALPSPEPKVLELDPRLVVDVALGGEPPEEIAARYGLNADQWDQLRTNKHFRLAVAQKLAELKKGGVTFKVKAGMMAEDLLADVYKKAKQPDVGLAALLTTAQWLTKVAELEPKSDAKGIGGNGFSITINLPAPVEPTPQLPAIEGDAVREP